MLTANRVLLPDAPPYSVVPYNTLPDKTNPACKLTPSMPSVKLCRVVKVCAVHPASQDQAEAGDQHGQEKRFFNASFHKGFRIQVGH